MNNSAIIKRNWVRKSDGPQKYNSAFRANVEEWTVETAADDRTGADTGSEMEQHNHD
jgi:hypothetical protein